MLFAELAGIIQGFSVWPLGCPWKPLNTQQPKNNENAWSCLLIFWEFLKLWRATAHNRPTITSTNHNHYAKSALWIPVAGHWHKNGWQIWHARTVHPCACMTDVEILPLKMISHRRLPLLGWGRSKSRSGSWKAEEGAEAEIGATVAEAGADETAEAWSEAETEAVAEQKHKQKQKQTQKAEAKSRSGKQTQKQQKQKMGAGGGGERSRSLESSETNKETEANPLAGNARQLTWLRSPGGHRMAGLGLDPSPESSWNTFLDHSPWIDRLISWLRSPSWDTWLRPHGSLKTVWDLSNYT